MNDYIGPIVVCAVIAGPFLFGWLYDLTKPRTQGWLPPLIVQPPGHCECKCRCNHE